MPKCDFNKVARRPYQNFKKSYSWNKLEKGNVIKHKKEKRN